MFKKILTHWIILMLTVLPVQVINASAKNNAVSLSNIQMSMEKTTQVNHECMHALAKESQKVSKMPCCDDSYHQCDGYDSCGDCSQATSAMFLPSMNSINNLNLNIQKIISNHLSLNGTSQKNLIRPPRIII